MVSKSRPQAEAPANRGQMCPRLKCIVCGQKERMSSELPQAHRARQEASAPRGQDGRPARRRQLAREERGRRDVVARRRVGCRSRRRGRLAGARLLLLRRWARGAGAREVRGFHRGGRGGIAASVEDDRRPEDAGAVGERAQLPRRAEGGQGGGGGGGDAEGGGEGARRGETHRGVRDGGLRERRGDGQRRGGERVPRRAAVRREQLRLQGEPGARRVGEEGGTRCARLVGLQVGEGRRELRRLNRDGSRRARAIDAILQLLVSNLRLLKLLHLGDPHLLRRRVRRLLEYHRAQPPPRPAVRTKARRFRALPLDRFLALGQDMLLLLDGIHRFLNRPRSGRGYLCRRIRRRRG
mmetsp:Transcript_32997/g.84091  ORF Transcript_32997/g.84091 Transcript_32997/m.84091 type:complete len:353 (+) Transcript_32997:160-1218(+)